jgi:hypothetical protein
MFWANLTAFSLEAAVALADAEAAAAAAAARAAELAAEVGVLRTELEEVERDYEAALAKLEAADALARTRG